MFNVDNPEELAARKSRGAMQEDDNQRARHPQEPEGQVKNATKKAYEFEICWPGGRVWRRARTLRAAKEKIELWMNHAEEGDMDPGFIIRRNESFK